MNAPEANRKKLDTLLKRARTLKRETFLIQEELTNMNRSLCSDPNCYESVTAGTSNCKIHTMDADSIIDAIRARRRKFNP